MEIINDLTGDYKYSSGVLKKLSEKTGIETHLIKKQIKDSYDEWFNAMSGIADEMASEYKMYKWQKKDSKKDKLSDWTLFSTVSALMARDYISRPEAEFTTSEIGEQNWVKNLNSAYQSDMNKINQKVLKYWQDFHKIMGWVAITCSPWWDWGIKAPMFEVISPEYWIPDPMWDYLSWDYRYNGFFRDYSRAELQNKWLYHEDLKSDTRKSSTRDAKTQKNADSGVFTTTGWDNSWNADDIYEIQHFFWKFLDEDWEVTMAHITLWNDWDIPLACEIIDFFPFSFKYWNPDGSITWMRVAKIAWDAQRVKAMIWNLRLEKSFAELYPMYLADTKMLPNSVDLEFWFNKVIEINKREWESLENAIAPMSKDFRADNSMITDQIIDWGVESATGMWRIAKWASPERREWVGTNQLISDSTDVLLAFRSKIEAIWEEQFMRLWLNRVRHELKNGDVKNVDVETSYGLVEMKFKKKDFILRADLHIKISTQMEIDEKKQKQTVAYGTFIWFSATLGLPKSAMNFMYRKYWELIWIPSQEVERMVWYTPWEIEALENANFLNQWVKIKVTPWLDIEANLSAIRSCKPSVQVEVFKQWLLSLYKHKEKAWTLPAPQEDPQAQNAMANNMASQAVSNTSWMQQAQAPK